MPIATATYRGGHHPVNQDSVYISDRGRVHALVVCDGHGERGEAVSSFLAGGGRLARAAIGAIAEQDGFNPGVPAERGESAARNAIAEADTWVTDGNLPAENSGSTAAGIFFDTQSRLVYAFTVGDSLAAIFRQDGVASAMPLQNASLMPRALQDRILELQWRSGDALVGGSRGSSRYMLIPGEPQSGLQVYSTVGDFAVKSANPAVTLDPIVKRWGPLPRNSTLLVASDGYYDGVTGPAYTPRWLRAIGMELHRTRGDPRALAAAARARGSRDDVTVITERV